MERFNGEIRDREKVIRGLKKSDTPVLKGYRIYHNYVRSHEALDGRTPAEAAGIKVESENKWLTLIQNASKRTKGDIMSVQ
jgi:transposase InsO family protein